MARAAPHFACRPCPAAIARAQLPGSGGAAVEGHVSRDSGAQGGARSVRGGSSCAHGGALCFRYRARHENRPAVGRPSVTATVRVARQGARESAEGTGEARVTDATQRARSLPRAVTRGRSGSVPSAAHNAAVHAGKTRGTRARAVAINPIVTHAIGWIGFAPETDAAAFLRRTAGAHRAAIHIPVPWFARAVSRPVRSVVADPAQRIVHVGPNTARIRSGAPRARA